MLQATIFRGFIYNIVNVTAMFISRSDISVCRFRTFTYTVECNNLYSGM